MFQGTIRSMKNGGPTAGSRTGRWWHSLLAVVLVLLSLPVFVALAIAIRLTVGPIDVTDSARRLLAKYHTPGLTVGHVRLGWNGWRQGPTAPLDLLVEDVRLGQARIGHGAVSLDDFALLHGRVAIVSLAIRDGAAVLYRDRGGAIGLQPSGSQPPHDAGPARSSSGVDLGRLTEVSITRSAITLETGARPSCHADIADLILNPLHLPAATGVTGHIDASLSCRNATLKLSARGWEGPEGGDFWHAVTTPARPSDFAGVLPSLAPLAALDLPVGLTVDTALSGGSGQYMVPRELQLTAQLDAGMIRPAAGTESIAIRQGSLHLALKLPATPQGAMQVVLSDGLLALSGADFNDADAPVLHLAGALSRNGPRIRAELDAGIARIRFAGLQHYWPRALGRGTHDWVTGNITAGIGRNLAVRAGLASDSGWDGLHLSTISGGLDANDLTVFWLRPIPPLHDMDAHLVLEGPDALRIESRHATQDGAHGPIAAGPTSMRITGLSRKDQLGRIDTHLRGGLPDLLTLLANPRLRLLSQHPLSFTDPSGDFDAHLVLSVPLIDRVKAEDIPISVDARLAEVHLGHVAAGRDLDHASLAVTATTDGLRLHGNGMISGLPSSFVYSIDFRPGRPGQTVESAHVSAQVDEAAIQREGLDAAHRLTGAAVLDLDYDSKRSGAATIALNLDLTGSGLETPLWRKASGTAARASGLFGLQDNRLVSITRLHASGPGLLLDAHADVDAGHPDAVVIERFEIGRSHGRGRIDLPGVVLRPLHVALQGDALDLVSLGVARTGTAKAAPAPASGPASLPGPRPMPWRADLAFRKVMFSAGRMLTGVTLHAEASGMRVSNASLAIDGPTAVTATIAPDRNGRQRRRHVTMAAQDVGALLRGLDVAGRIEGGVLSLQGWIEDRPTAADPGATRLTAIATVGRFTVHDAPLAARLARDLSIYGFLLGAPSKQIIVTKFEIPFTVDGDTLFLTDAHASNDALGATLRGPVDLRQESLDLRGTIVPFNLFNALPGTLPGLGKVFSPEKGGGLLAATLSIKGPIDQPAIRVNPLALLAPGILRRLLFN